LEIPPQIAKFLSLYLLMALGLKGGFALSASGLRPEVAGALGAALLLAFIVPALGYAALRRFVAPLDAAAIAAAYGSVSAVTFVTATQILADQGLAAGGHMTVAMVLMESPAIVMAVFLAGAARRGRGGASELAAASESTGIGHVLRHAFTDGALLLLLGALAIGYISGDAGKAVMQPFAGDLFKGLLAFFLLDMGLVVARSFAQARQASPVLIAYAVVGPLVHAGMALGLAVALEMPAADAALLMVLAASASYIVVPAVLREAIPEANPALYLGLSLGVTFPLNLLVGIPLYIAVATATLG
jgi:hypothetical protein